MTQDTVNKAVVVLLALGISALFLAMIWQFLMAILLSGIFAGLSRPLYSRLRHLFGGLRHLAAIATLLILAVMVVLPLGLLGSVLVAQTLDLSQSLALWLKENLEQPEARAALLGQLPFHDQLAPHWNTLAKQAGQPIGSSTARAAEAGLTDRKTDRTDRKFNRPIGSSTARAAETDRKFNRTGS